MSKIDIDKLVAYIYENEQDYQYMQGDSYLAEYIPKGSLLYKLRWALFQQGLEYRNGGIVEIEPKLSNLEQNGKECKPANFAKSCKDLQEPKQEHKFKVGDRVLYFGNTYKILSVEDDGYVNDHQGFIPKTMEDAMSLIEEPNQELTEFEKAFITSYDAYAEGFNTIMKWRDYAKLKSKQLLEIAYKQFKQDQMNQEFATFTRQEFNEAVDEEIKRRCDAIDATKMSDRYYHTLLEKWFKCDVAHDRELGYMKGVEDTIKKLKGE